MRDDGAGPAKQLINERRLAMIDMGDDRNIANFLSRSGHLDIPKKSAAIEGGGTISACVSTKHAVVASNFAATAKKRSELHRQSNRNRDIQNVASIVGVREFANSDHIAIVL